MYRKNKKEEFYTKKAKEEGYPARSVYKLLQIDEEFGIIRKGDSVLDLGSAPGSWLLYVSKKIGKKGRVFGIDKEEIKIPGRDNIVFIKKSIEDEDIRDVLREEKFDSVIADLSPKTTGIKSVDSGRSLELTKRAFFIAKNVLKKRGNFVCKIFEGGEADIFLKKISARFRLFKRYRPKAVSRGSKEFYIVAKTFKPL
jgi:23S rRNA (uridine2552-2'-O)-methyltransferase